MFAFFVRRILWAIPVLFFVSLVTFTLMHIAPGGPFDREDKRVDARTLAALNERFGLDKPPYLNFSAPRELLDAGEYNPLKLARSLLDSQYGNYMINAVQGDLGPSYRQRGQDVQDILLKLWPNSARLGILALIFAVVVGVPLGIIAALKQNTWIDYISLFFATIGVSLPTFVTGLLVLIIFGNTLKWINIVGNDWSQWKSYLAPALVLGLSTMSFITRITRTTVLEIKRQDFIRTARAKGLSETVVTLRHLLRNAMIPIVTLLGPALVDLITGAVITESIFGISGIGRFFVESIGQRDYSMIMGTTLMYATLVVFANILVDLSYGLLDPRIRNQG